MFVYISDKYGNPGEEITYGSREEAEADIQECYPEVRLFCQGASRLVDQDGELILAWEDDEP